MTDKDFSALFAGRLRYYLDVNQMAQVDLAKKLGVSTSTVSSWVNGDKIPRMGKVDAMCKVFGCKCSDLITEPLSEPGTLPSNIILPAARPIPILGVISCGGGISDDDFDGYFFMDRSVKADYCLRVRGDSMIDAGIRDGDYAFIQKDCEIADGKIYAVVEKCNSEALLKKLYRADGKVILQSCNPTYSPIVKDGDDISVVGELVGVYHVV